MKKPILIIVVVAFSVVIGGVVAWAVADFSVEKDQNQDESLTENSSVFDDSEFTLEKKEKLITGEIHSITKMNLEYTENYDRVVFSFAENQQSITPGYIAELKDQIIWIRFLDTRDVDMNMKNTFIGEKSLTGQGKVIEKVGLWYPGDDSSIGAKIYLTEARGFRITEKSSNIFLDVNCGCG